MTPSAAALIAKVGLRRLMARALFAPLRDRGERQRRVHQFTFASDAEAVAYPFARGHGRLPDFAAPTLLPEKVRWTFLHHPNPLMSLVSDKIAVRDYLALRGALIQPPDLIATGHDPEAILTLDLPERFVLKASNSCGANHVHPGPNPPDRGSLRDLLVRWRDEDHWRRHGELFYRAIPWRFLVEEYLPSDRRRLEYKIMCFHGEPQFISAIAQRGPGGLSRSVHLPDWSAAGFGTRGLGVSPEPVPRPDQLGFLLDEARRLSADLMHVRVDILHYNDRLSFSELTLSNAAARHPIDPPEAALWLGSLIDLSRAAEYEALGRKIAADLGWPPVPNGGGNLRSHGLSAET